MQRRILLGKDESTGTALRKSVEGDATIHLEEVSDANAALHALMDQNHSIFLMNLAAPEFGGMALIEEIQKRNIPVAVIVVTAPEDIEMATQAMRLGAWDILIKPLNPRHLQLALKRVLRERRLQDEVASLRDQLQHRYSFHNIISKSPRMHAVFELINNIAQSNATVLIEGETGTGKEQIARAIHEACAERTGSLVPVHCAALPETLLESELFGHEKGAFTSAVNKRVGRFELAHGGTLFLDEVGDIPPSMQAKLLRVLQERNFERLGGTECVEVDVRVVGATNRSLAKMVQEGKFREDLYYRLNVVKVELPPLRERPEDIPLLAVHFAAKYARPGESAKQIPPDAMQVLLKYSWPGNIRELENAIERACVTSHNGSILPQNFPPELLNPPPTNPGIAVDVSRPMPELMKQVQADFEEQYIRKALENCRGNVNQCAKVCGISRRSLSAKLGAYQINKAVFKTIGNVIPMDEQQAWVA